MDDSDESLFNIINTFTTGVGLSEHNGNNNHGTNAVAGSSRGSQPKDVTSKMFSDTDLVHSNGHNNSSSLQFQAASLFMASHGLMDNTWAFNSASDGSFSGSNNLNAFQGHRQPLASEVGAVVGSMGNSDKSLSFNSDSNDSNDHGGLLQQGNVTTTNGSSAGRQQFRDNSQSPATFFSFNNSGSSSSSSPPLSQNSGPTSASSITESGTTSTLKFNNNSMATSALTNSSFGSSAGGALLGGSTNQVRPFNSFAQAVAARTTLAPVGSAAAAAGASTMSVAGTNGGAANAFGGYSNAFQQSHSALNGNGVNSRSVNGNNNNNNTNNNSSTNLIDSLFSSSALEGLPSYGFLINNGASNNGTSQQQQQQPQSQPSRHFSDQTVGGQAQNNNNNNNSRPLLHSSHSQDSLATFFRNSNVATTPVTSSGARNFSSNFGGMYSNNMNGNNNNTGSNNNQRSFANNNNNSNVARNEIGNTNGVNNNTSSQPYLQHQPTCSSNSTNLFISNHLNTPTCAMGNMNRLKQAQLSLQAQLERQMQSLVNEIQSTANMQITTITSRREHLLKQLEQVRIAHSVMLNQAMAEDANQLLRLSTMEKMPFNHIRFNHPDQSSQVYRSVTTLGYLQSPAFGHYCQVAGEGLTFSVEGEPSCFMVAVKDILNEDIVAGGDKLDIDIVPIEINHAAVSPTTSAELLQLIPKINMSILDNNNGNYNVTYIIPKGFGITRVRLSISVNDLAAANSPFQVAVRTERSGGETWKRVAIYGEEGSEPGRFCRPWGVAMAALPLRVNPAHDPDNVKVNIPLHSKPYFNFESNPARQEFLMAVADRSNNRIQILKLTAYEAKRDMFAPPGFASAKKHRPVNITVVHVFGSGPGTRHGQFDRPAGIAFNTNLGHLVVADKDNHRVQVFDLAGNFQLKFGEKGSRAGQFCYPWDVAVCPQTSMILVSDTRNRRIQLFTHYGQYLWHCGQPLDSPRGVAFLTPDRYLVSDFNKHRLLIIDRNESHLNAHSGSSTSLSMPQRADDLNSLRYIGFGEGSAWGEFLRPQGLVANISHGYSGNKPLAMQILCADSRNNRISIWNSINQNFDYISGETVQNDNYTPAPFDRPSGIAMAGNFMAVIDFGFNRLQIFERTTSER